MPETQVAPPSTNGTAATPLKRELEDVLQQRLTLGYTPTLPLWAMLTDVSYVPQIYILRDLELMTTHPIVRSALDYFKGGLANVEIESEALDPTVKTFVDDHCRRFWETGMPLVQGGYEYGWIALENNYHRDDAGLMAWKSSDQFSPRDVYLLTQAHEPVGVRVKNVPEKGNVDLWLSSPDVPAKALWYAHNPRFSRYYGQSQLLGAWRPWRRLAWKDGAESTVDMAIYRNGVAGPVVKYPEEDLQIEAGAGAIPAGTTLDSQGRPRRYARDIARFIAETYKSGAGVGLPSTCYPPEMGGKPKWELELPQSTLNVSGLIEYVKYLQDQIYFGIGIAPELMSSGETGSGYSGRKLPMDAFLMGQQRIANAILNLFLDQILRPLVRWNFGVQATFKAWIPSILEQTRKAATGATTAEGDPTMRPDQVPGPGAQQRQRSAAPQGAPWMPEGNMASFSLAREQDHVEHVERVLSLAQRILKKAA